MINTTHYTKLLQDNPNALINLTLAASAVYSARNGQFDNEDAGTDEWKNIYRDLKSRYGENLTPEQVRTEMERRNASTPTVQVNFRLPLTLAGRLDAAKARTGQDKQSIIIQAIQEKLDLLDKVPPTAGRKG